MPLLSLPHFPYRGRRQRNRTSAHGAFGSAGTLPRMTPEQVVRELWNRIAACDWPGVRALLAPDLRVVWPASGEVFLGAANFVAVQAEYPEGWAIRILRLVADGETVVSEVEVPHEQMGGTFRAASIWTVRDELVVAGTEYWVTIGQDEAPAWRERYAERPGALG